MSRKIRESRISPNTWEIKGYSPFPASRDDALDAPEARQQPRPSTPTRRPSDLPTDTTASSRDGKKITIRFARHRRSGRGELLRDRTDIEYSLRRDGNILFDIRFAAAKDARKVAAPDYRQSRDVILVPG